MAESLSRAGKRKPGGSRSKPASIPLSLAPDLLARVDAFLKTQKDNPSRPQAIQRLVELGLAALRPAGRTNSRHRAKALDLAGEQIDKLIDASAPQEERERRKRRLLKGPKEFRDIRGD
jgi:hypothetical protein